MAKKKRTNPVYAATHEAWAQFFARDPVKAHQAALVEVARQSGELLHGRGAAAKREAKHKLSALLAILRAHAPSGISHL